MALEADPTEAGYNSFVSLEAATEYFANTYFAGGEQPWLDFSEEEQAQLLITASRRISALPWTGVPLLDTQLLAFPRSYTSYEYGGVTEIGSEEAPSWLVALTCEMARWIWEEGNRSLSDLDTTLIKSMKVGEIAVTYQDAGRASSLPPAVEALLGVLSPQYILFKSGARSMSMRY